MAAIPLLTNLPSPALSTDPEDVFNSKTDATLLAQQNFVNVDMNTKVIPGINTTAQQVTADKGATAASASAAADSATFAAQQVGLATDQVTLAVNAKNAAAASATNAAASATAAEASSGSIGNLALLYAVALSF